MITIDFKELDKLEIRTLSKHVFSKDRLTIDSGLKVRFNYMEGHSRLNVTVQEGINQGFSFTSDCNNFIYRKF